MSWTIKQEELLRENARHGVKVVREVLFRECGIDRSEHAIEAHASRIHVSLKKRVECPECGRISSSINRQTGMCPICSKQYHIAVQKAYNELLEAELSETADEAELQRLQREYDAQRQRTARLRKRIKVRETSL